MKENEPDLAVAVDIGATKMDAALIDAHGHAIGEIERHAVPFAGGVASLDRLLDLLEPFVHRAHRSRNRLRGMGVSLAGLVDLATGRVSIACNLGWFDVPLGEIAGARFGLPIYAAMDTRMAALGEATWGAARGVENFVWVTVGSGLGSCMFLGGRPYGGDHGFAGVFGHNTVDENNGQPCSCGRRGCLETSASGLASARIGQAAVAMGHKDRAAGHGGKRADHSGDGTSRLRRWRPGGRADRDTDGAISRDRPGRLGQHPRHLLDHLGRRVDEGRFGISEAD